MSIKKSRLHKKVFYVDKKQVDVAQKYYFVLKKLSIFPERRTISILYVRYIASDRSLS